MSITFKDNFDGSPDAPLFYMEPARVPGIAIGRS